MKFVSLAEPKGLGRPVGKVVNRKGNGKGRSLVTDFVSLAVDTPSGNMPAKTLHMVVDAYFGGCAYVLDLSGSTKLWWHKVQVLCFPS